MQNNKKYTIWSLIWGSVSNPYIFSLVYLTSALGTIARLAQYVYMGELADVMNADGFKLEDGIFLLWLILSLYIGMHILWRLTGHLEAIAIPNMMHNLRHRLISDTLSRKTKMFTNELSGAFVGRLCQLGRAVKQLCSSFEWTMMNFIVETILVLAYAFSTSLAIGLSMSLWFIFMLGISYFYIRRVLYHRVKRLARRRAAISGHNTDLISNSPLVLTTDWFGYGVKKFNKVSFDLRDALRDVNIKSNVFYIIMGFGQVAFLASSVYFAATQVNADAMTIGEFIAITFLLSRVSTVVWSGCQELMGVLENVALMREGIDFLERYEVQDLDTGKELSLRKAPSLEFKNIKFKYNEKADILFDNFNLKIKSGERVALIGHSGAGKTSLVNLALSFYEPEDGQLLINRKPVSDYSKNSYRQQISIISQDTSMFHQSVRDNIAYGSPNATEEQIVEAAKKAHAHEFISKLQHGYDSMVGDRGVQLSGGQRQRIAIARAILKNSPIFILDEATSALDSESEHYIQDSLKDVMQNKTVIAIAHRLSTISEMDRIVVLDQGKIAEQGTHEELLEHKGIYAKMWAMQSGGFLKED